MKIINLLNKIANEEEVPKKIKYAGIIWEYDNTTKDYISDDMFLIYTMNSFALNKSFEILEEEKKIPTLNDIRESYGLPRIEEKKIPEKLYLSDYEDTTGKFDYDVLLTINEIIDYLKSKGE